MNRFIVLLIIGLLSLPNFAVAGSLDDLDTWLDTERFTFNGNFQVSAASIDINDTNYDRYSAQLRVGIEAKIADNVALGGRLGAYTYWGDFNDTYSDTIRAERAYLNWWGIANSNFHLSIGRRPLFYGSPANATNNNMHIGTPYGYSADFNIDGVTIGYQLSPLTGVTGMNIRLCYGNGIESEWGNETHLKDDISTYLVDAQLAGINFDLYNDDKTVVQISMLRATDVNDGTNGTLAFPTQYAGLFAPIIYTDIQKFEDFNFNANYTPSTVIGNINLVTLGFSRQEDNGVNWFGSVGMTQLKPNGKAGIFGGMGTDTVFEAQLSDDGSEIIMTPVRAEDDNTQEGYGVYVGIQTPAPMGKFGFEYNYGSQYWTPFTQNQDDVLGNKLTTRGHAAEAYYTFDISQNAFLKIGAIYYDYEYTGSGTPVGKPLKIKDVKAGRTYSLIPVVDTAWDTYAKIIIEF